VNTPPGKEPQASWQLLSSTTVLDSRWIRVLRNEYRRPPRGETVSDYYIVEKSDFVMVVPVLADTVLLVKQYRPATDRVYLALPAGYIDSGESPQDAAVRELAEETGYTAAGERTVLGSLDPLPGYIRSRCWVVICTGVDSTTGAPDDEIEEVVSTAWDDIPALIRTGAIDEMQTVGALALAMMWRSAAGGSDMRLSR
jgi:ADP-ribose pyrophosphatase